MDTKELVSWFRMAQIDPYYGTAIQARFEQAADTIERLQKESIQSNVQLRSELTGAHDAMDALVNALTKTEQERDAALAEVERLEARDEKQASMIRSIDPLYR